jgi:polar amino acid transport system substrate-binding protein
MAKIQDRGKLIVGVDQNTKYFGYRDPRTGKLDGLDIDMLRAVARALFGVPAGANVDARLDFRAVTTGERIPAVQHGDVDIVASLITVTPERQQQVCLSSVYYLAHQGVLVRDDGQISSPQDLAGKRVCATKGSTSITQFHQLVPKAVMAPVTFRTDCLVALEEGTVDAITADDTILLGFEAQDPKTAILPEALSDEPYAIAVSTDHPEFVRFVNAVLQRMRDDGSLADLYAKWLGLDAPPVPDPRYQG